MYVATLHDYIITKCLRKIVVSWGEDWVMGEGKIKKVLGGGVRKYVNWC